MKTRLIPYIFALVILMSCSDDDTVMIPSETEESLIELTFSNAPFDLQGAQASFAEDIPYDSYDKTKFDILMPQSATATGLVIFIHGGGFTGSDKIFAYHEDYQDQVIELLNSGIAVATINYRLLEDGDTDGVLKPLNDSRRALQYIRYIHKELNIDMEKIVLYGTSAGASTAMWIALQDDMREINSTDVVLHESTRVKGIALNATQSSLDIETRWLGDVFDEFDSTLDDIIAEFGAERLYNFYGVNTQADYETPEVEAYRKQVDMLTFFSADDPEVWVTNTSGHNEAPETSSSFNHHPYHARTVKEFADVAGVANITSYGNPVLFDDSNGEDYVSFLIRKINE